MPEKGTEHLICSLLSLVYPNQDESQDIAHKKCGRCHYQNRFYHSRKSWLDSCKSHHTGHVFRQCNNRSNHLPGRYLQKIPSLFPYLQTHKKGTVRVAGSRYGKSSESKTGMEKINRKGSKIRPHEFFRSSHRGFFQESMPVLAFLP